MDEIQTGIIAAVCMLVSSIITLFEVTTVVISLGCIDGGLSLCLSSLVLDLAGSNFRFL